jgi:hypothetical protein
LSTFVAWSFTFAVISVKVPNRTSRGVSYDFFAGVLGVVLVSSSTDCPRECIGMMRHSPYVRKALSPLLARSLDV